MNPLISILIVLAVMIVIVSLKLNLNYSILAGIVLTAILFQRGLYVFDDLFNAISSFENITIILAFVFIFFLAKLMDDVGALKKMGYSTEKIVKHTWVVMISIPFLIGLVPSPSGAILSAPFVEEVGNKAKISKERQHLINYWFRHISEYINPIYPGPILAAAIVGITFSKLVYINLPVMLTVFIVGALFYAIGIKQRELEDTKKSKKDILNILNGVAPIVIALALPIFLKLDLSISLLAAIGFTAITGKTGIVKLFSVFRKSIRIDIIIFIFLILIFKAVLQNSNAIELVSSDFLRYNFPSILMVLFVPMLIGALTGMTIAFVGIGFPLLMPFFAAGGNLDLGLIMLAYEAGYFGIMISPMHLCLTVTQKHFGLEFRQIFRRLIIPQLIVIGTTLIIYFSGWPF